MGDPEDHAVDAEKEAEIWKEADAPMLADEAAPEDQEEEETEPASVVDQEAVETVSGAVEVAGGDEAAEESQEVDESQEANAVPEDPMEGLIMGQSLCEMLA